MSKMLELPLTSSEIRTSLKGFFDRIVSGDRLTEIEVSSLKEELTSISFLKEINQSNLRMKKLSKEILDLCDDAGLREKTESELKQVECEIDSYPYELKVEVVIKKLLELNNLRNKPWG